MIDESGKYPKGELRTSGSGKVNVKCYICRHLVLKDWAEHLDNNIYKCRKCKDYIPGTYKGK